MAAPTLNAVSPSSGPLGTAITCSGAGFDTGARIGCPGLVPTQYVSATSLKAAIPADLVGPPGGEMVVGVFVQNEDGSRSSSLPFTIRFATVLQGWTTIDAVCAEVPGFQRFGSRIPDTAIEGWIRSGAQIIAGVMLGRGLSLDPAEWQPAAAGTGMPSPAGVLETINRLGAAARLAAAIASDFATQGEWPLVKNLQDSHTRELGRLEKGAYDKLFRPSAATLETGGQLAVGDLSDSQSNVERSFTKAQIF
jgi:hypothetical protein